jgi:hypothetical protein
VGSSLIGSVENMNPDMILKGMLIDDNVSSKNILKIKSKKDNNKHLILFDCKFAEIGLDHCNGTTNKTNN